MVIDKEELLGTKRQRYDDRLYHKLIIKEITFRTFFIFRKDPNEVENESVDRSPRRAKLT